MLFLGHVSNARVRILLQAEQGHIEVTATNWELWTATRYDADGNERAHTDNSKTSPAKQFVAAVRSKRIGLTTVAEALRGLATIQAAYEAAQTGQTAEVARFDNTGDR